MMQTVKLNMLLLGKTGQGKSATGNMLLNRRAFGVSGNSMSHTHKVDFSFNQIDDFILLVVDGPGLEDTARTKADDRATVAKNMKTALAMCYGGIDAFIFVLLYPFRFTSEERETLSSLNNILGDDFISNVIVVIAGGDNFFSDMEESDNPVTFNEWCRQQRAAFRDFYNDCEGRFVLFNNREKDENKKREQIMQVVHLARDLQTDTGRYTSQCFEDATEQREKFILEMKAPHLRLDFQEKICLLTAAIEKYCVNPTEGDKEKIRARIEDLKKEIDAEDQEYGVLDDMRHLVKEVEKKLNNVKALPKLQKDLENSRSAGSSCVIL